jgi:hypothetical protein
VENLTQGSHISIIKDIQLEKNHVFHHLRKYSKRSLSRIVVISLFPVSPSFRRRSRLVVSSSSPVSLPLFPVPLLPPREQLPGAAVGGAGVVVAAAVIFGVACRLSTPRAGARSGGGGCRSSAAVLPRCPCAPYCPHRRPVASVAPCRPVVVVVNS